MSYRSRSGGAPHRVGVDVSLAGPNYKRRMVQGDVTVNMDVDDSEPARRTDATTRLKDNQRMGAYTGAHQMHIVQGDLVFAVNAGLVRERDELPLVTRNLAVVSFNAFPLMGARTRDEFNQTFRFMGVAKNTYRYGEASQPLNGISVQHKGATTVPNTGLDTFYPGDKVRVRVPAVSAAQRATEAKYASGMRGQPNDRIVARPEAVNYAADVLDLPGRALRALFRSDRQMVNGVDAASTLRRLRPVRGRVLDQLTHFALAYKHAVHQEAWNAVAVLEAYGLIELRMPGAQTAATYASLDADVLARSLPAMLKGTRPTIETLANGTARVTGSTARGGAAAETRRAQLQWLALKLELVKDSATLAGSTFAPSQRLSDALMGASAGTFFAEQKHARLFDARRFLNPSVPVEALGGVHTSASNFSKETYGNQLAKSQADAATGFFSAAAEARLALDNTVVATALNHAKPGAPLDIVM